MRKIFWLAIVASSLVSSPALAKKKPEMTPMEIQALQSHDFETTKEILFASVVSVFQDLGYQLENADMPSGFITASSANKNKTSFLDALSYQRASGNTRATAFVEAFPNGTARVRLNFLNSKSTSGRCGSMKDDKAILDPQTYKVAWDKIDEAVFTRTATSTTPKSSAPASNAPPPPPVIVSGAGTSSIPSTPK